MSVFHFLMYVIFISIKRCYLFPLHYLLPHKILQHRAFSCALTANHGDLGKVQVGILSDRRKRILHSVNQRNQILHPPVSHSDCWLGFCFTANGRNSTESKKRRFLPVPFQSRRDVQTSKSLNVQMPSDK